MDVSKTREILKEKTVLIIGVGGLGGYVTECLARSGVGKLIIMDGDVFSESNLNRQLYATHNNLGESKAKIASNRVMEIADACAEAIEEFFTKKNAEVVKRADVVVDCVDSVEARLVIENACGKYGKTIVHAAINGTEGQVMTVPPNSGKLKKIYRNGGAETLPTICYAPAAVAAIQAAETVKFLMSGEITERLIIVDLDDASITKLKF